MSANYTTFKMYSGRNHPTCKRLGTHTMTTWTRSHVTYAAEVGACKSLIKKGHWSRVEVIDHVTGKTIELHG